MEGICKNCNKSKKDIAFSGEATGLCHVCYKKLLWKPKTIICKRCKRELPMHAKGFCAGCYNSVFHIERVRYWNAKIKYNLDPDLYQKLTEKCVICGFDKIVDLHHVDLNHNNNSPDNLAGLCPNHHKMIHHRDFRKEVLAALMEKGFKTPHIYEDDEYYKRQASSAGYKYKSKTLKNPLAESSNQLQKL